MFTYALEAFDVAPILALCSPLKRCGKRTTEEVITALAKRPLAAANVTVAALYRTVKRFAPALIVDEADTFLLNNLALRGQGQLSCILLIFAEIMERLEVAS